MYTRFTFVLFMYVYVCLSVWVFMYVQVPARLEASDGPGAGVISGCKLLDVGTENQTQVFCKSSTANFSKPILYYYLGLTWARICASADTFWMNEEPSEILFQLASSDPYSRNFKLMPNPLSVLHFHRNGIHNSGQTCSWPRLNNDVIKETGLNSKKNSFPWFKERIE